MTERMQRALAFATKKHQGQKRIGGDDYITHPIAVSEIVKSQGFDENYQIAALFHDLLEDTDATEEDVLTYANQEILEAVKLLTKEHGYNMAEYVGAIKQNSIAYAVKAADRLHNLQCALITSEEFKRKYILETLDWYMDFSPEIRKAVKNLAQSLETPMAELSFLYEPIESWKQKN
ncbi:MAG: bifunctional (p)ppGpp synthetase/guanosine-3',5'-bis(diphosphate) 3'-pyrophosphohydrolase [Ruminococcaceae bacterium]|nr:bifunctional (p)ppGpp synthetase/guanosine-3',5'-bis(diphosphate) 3'-pyrophosphohydrolase [Oscillospiraceae bacterium]